MIGHSDKIFFWRQLILLISLLVTAFLFNEFINFKEGYLVYLGYLIEGTLVFLIAKVSYVIILQIISFHYYKAYHKSPPPFYDSSIAVYYYFLHAFSYRSFRT